MAVKSTRRRARRDETAAKANLSMPLKCVEDRYLDGLADTELDRVLHLGEDRVPTTKPKASTISNTPVLPWMHLTSSPPRQALKEDQFKISFLDLPAEIRVSVYEFYCQSLLENFDIPNHRLQVRDSTADDGREDGYSLSLLEMQLVCHQIHDELISTWARYTTFMICMRNSLASSTTNRQLHLRSLDMIWSRVRDLLNCMGPIARREVRKIRVCWVDMVFDDLWEKHLTPVCFCPRHMHILKRETGPQLASSFECLSDVHPDLAVEVELMCSGGPSDFIAAKRTFTLRQRPWTVVREGRRWTLDWECDSGEVYNIHAPWGTYQDSGYTYWSIPCPQAIQLMYKDEQWQLANVEED